MEENRHISKEERNRIRALRKKIKTGSSNAKLELAKIYYDMPPGKYDIKMMKMLYELANEGNTDAMLYLARVWSRGIRFKNIKKYKIHNFLVRYEGADQIFNDSFPSREYVQYDINVIDRYLIFGFIPFAYERREYAVKWYLNVLKNDIKLTKEDFQALIKFFKGLELFSFDKYERNSNIEYDFNRLVVSSALKSLFELAAYNKNAYASVLYFKLCTGERIWATRGIGFTNENKTFFNIFGWKRRYYDASPFEFAELIFIHEAMKNDSEDIGAILEYTDFMYDAWLQIEIKSNEKLLKKWFIYYNNEITNILDYLTNSNNKFSKEYIDIVLNKLNKCLRQLAHPLACTKEECRIVFSPDELVAIIQSIERYYDEYLVSISMFYDYYTLLLYHLTQEQISHELRYEYHIKELLTYIYSNDPNVLTFIDLQNKSLDQSYKNIQSNAGHIVELTNIYMRYEDVSKKRIDLPYLIAVDIRYFVEPSNEQLSSASNQIFIRCKEYFEKIILSDNFLDVKKTSHYCLAQMYKYGYGIEANFEKAKYHLIEYGNLSGEHISNQLGLLCFWFDKYDDAIKNYKEALTEIGDDLEVKAMIEYNIGYTYNFLKYIKNDEIIHADNVDNALKWFRLSYADGCKYAGESIMMIADGVPDKIRSLEAANNQILTYNMEMERLKTENERMKIKNKELETKSADYDRVNEENQFWKNTVASGMENLQKIADEIYSTTHRTEEKIDYFIDIVKASDEVMSKSIADLSAEIGDMHGDLEDIDAKIDEKFEELSKTQSKWLIDNINNTDDNKIKNAETHLHNIADPIYNMLEDSTKEGLIAAELIYNTLKTLKISFSGVVIHLCASLEQQLKYVFWYTYKNFCRRKYGNRQADLKKWPSKLTYPKDLKNSKKLSESGHFFLGDLYMYCHPDEMKPPHNSDDNMIKNLNDFRDFLKVILKDECYDEDEPEKALDNLVERIETIRKNFRNESAHGKTMNLDAAEECYRLVLGKDGEKSVFNMIYDVVDAQKVNEINDQKGKR